MSLTVTLPDGSSQTGEFYNGEFVFTQSAGGTVIAALTGGSFADLPATHARRTRGSPRCVRKEEAEDRDPPAVG